MFNIINVKGDGNCFYRCIIGISREYTEIYNYFQLKQNNTCNENIKILRNFVANSIINDDFSQKILKNLFELYKDVPFIIENYSFLKYFEDDKDIEYNYNKISEVIKNSNIMASSLEVDIINHIFEKNNIKLCVVSYSDNYDKNKLPLKWFKEILTILKNSTYENFSILINYDNVHYKYCKFMDKIKINRNEFINLIKIYTLE